MAEKRIFRISQDNLKILFDQYTITDTQTGNSTAAMIGQYWKKSFKTGSLEITRVSLLREVTWARKNGLVEWSNLVMQWAELA